jgi:hypothetical protein
VRNILGIKKDKHCIRKRKRECKRE